MQNGTDIFNILTVNKDTQEMVINFHANFPPAEVYETFFQILALNAKGYYLCLSKENQTVIEATANQVQELVTTKTPTYGINTGFGQMINVIIPPAEAELLQKNLIKTHATGIGTPFTYNETRAILLVRIFNLIRGYSGVRIETIKRLIHMFNKHCFPVIPSQGSLGASGDLAPLAHLANGLICEEHEEIAFWHRTIKYHMTEQVSWENAYVILNWDIAVPYKLTYKEGLALINGTSASLGIALLACDHFAHLLEWSLRSIALTLAGLKASSMPFAPYGNWAPIRSHYGQHFIAGRIRNLLLNCSLIESHIDRQKAIQAEVAQHTSDKEVIATHTFLQSAYSLRVIPQVVGAVMDTFEHFQETLENELSSISDNPILTQDGIFHGANFHGQYIAFNCDYMRIAVTQLAQLIDRQIARMIESHYSGLPDLLAYKNQGLQCAFEGMQYSSTSVLAEMKALCMPCSIQSIPANLNNQDLVSMSLPAARMLAQAVTNCETIVCVELILAAQAVEFQLMALGIDPPTECKKNKAILGDQLYPIWVKLREVVPFLKEDCYLGNWIAQVRQYINPSLE